MGFTALVGVIFPFVVAAVWSRKTGYRVDAPWWIIFNGAVVMPISFFCLATGPRYISGAEVAMFYLLETVLAPVWVWVIFSEVPTRNSLIGGSDPDRRAGRPFAVAAERGPEAACGGTCATPRLKPILPGGRSVFRQDAENGKEKGAGLSPAPFKTHGLQ